MEAMGEFEASAKYQRWPGDGVVRGAVPRPMSADHRFSYILLFIYLISLIFEFVFIFE